MMEIKLLGMVVVMFVEFKNILLVEEFHLFVPHLVEMEFGISMPLKNVIMERKKLLMVLSLRTDVFRQVMIKI